MKKFGFFIGFDIGKLYLDVCVTDGTRPLVSDRINNKTDDIKVFLAALKASTGVKASNTVFGMEQTGIYGNHLLAVLLKMKASIVNENAVHIKNSLGLLRGKNDKLDAFRIAEYLFRSRDRLSLWKGKREILIELSALLSLRERLMSMLHILKVPLKEAEGFTKKTSLNQNLLLCLGTINAVKVDIVQVESSITSLWSSDEPIAAQMKIICSIPCIGELTALNIIITTNEFKNITSAKKFACYAGIAPFMRQSGSSVMGKSRISHIANKKTKSLLHTCAILSVRFVPELKAYFIRKTEGEHKNKMLVYNAIRSKLVLRVFSCIKAMRMFEQDYDYKQMQSHP
ncbi:transposase [Pedobacter aquatilis]|uniref:transposase n=1 Tax=Pedobacter aquatilis TaxID=351343 RepID=UPI00293146C7|nr:transposase [Pedobacter aquatilis]